MEQDPTKPKAPPSLEMVLSQQANEAIQAGADPHAATEMLGTMVRHLRSSPSLSKQGADALSQGADPHAVARTVWELAQSTSKPPEKPGVLSRAGSIIGDFASNAKEHPLETAGEMITSPLKSFLRTFNAPVVGEEVSSARYNRGKAGALPGSLQIGDRITRENTPGAITKEEHRAAGASTVAAAAFPGVAGTISGRLVAAGVPRLLATTTGLTVAGSGAGAATNPSDPLAGAVAGGATAAVLGATVPPVIRAVKAGTSSATTALALRPSGLTAQEMAADAASRSAPVGPQASATPVQSSIQSATKSGPQLGPTFGQRTRAAAGRVVEKAGVESSKTRALREVARRFELDNVTEPDALAYADRAGNKPVAVLDLGAGNVGGLARTAKDVPSLARRQIPEFLHERSGGTFGNEGATLQRITSDIEQRIGLAPEDYYATVEDMTQRMKNTAASDYGKIRNQVVDDVDALSLFDEPEFRAVHDAIRRNARLRNGEQIPPLREKPAESLRDAQGRIRENLNSVARKDLEAESRRLSQLNAQEEAYHSSVKDAGYRHEYEELPDMERTGRSTRKVDQFGNKVKRQAEDLSDADGMMDPDKLAADNKIIKDYNRSQIVRRAREQAIRRINAELNRRPVADDSFDFGANADDGFDFYGDGGAPRSVAPEPGQFNPQTLGTLDKMKRHLDQIISGKIEGGPIQRDAAYAMRERLNTALDRMDELYPEYKQARSNYRGSAEAIEAYETGKAEFLRLDPRAIQQKLAKMPERLQDLYRRGGYDALRSEKLTRMDDGANIGAFLEKNPDIRARIAALAKNADDQPLLRSDFNVERQMGDRKNFILGGPNSAERMIEHASTVPRVTQAGNLVRNVPGVGKFAAHMLDNTLTRRLAEQTGDVMGEVGKVMTRTGRPGIQSTFGEIAALKAKDLERAELARQIGTWTTSRITGTPPSRR